MATLTIASKNYGSWSLRGWLLAKFSGLEFEEVVTAPDDASARAEIQTSFHAGGIASERILSRVRASRTGRPLASR